MKEYEVIFTATHNINVDAENEEEAEQKASELFTGFDKWDTDVEEIEVTSTEKEIIEKENMDSRTCNKCGDKRNTNHVPYSWNGKEYLCIICEEPKVNREAMESAANEDMSDDERAGISGL